MGEPIRVLVVQASALMRQAVAQRLEASGAEVVGKAQTNAEALVEYAQRHPDVVILDVRLGAESGFVLIADLLECYPDAVAVVYSGLNDAQLAKRAVEAGAAGYICRDASRAELHDCLMLALRGVRPVLDQRITGQRPGNSCESGPSSAHPRQLTARQQEVLELMAAGTTSNKDIAKELFISEKTVKSHIERIAASLDVSRRTQLALRALELGLIPATEPAPAGLTGGRSRGAMTATSRRPRSLIGSKGLSMTRHRHPARLAPTLQSPSCRLSFERLSSQSSLV
jgi:DNA-binding NarL/FixJ family response regulator